MYTATRQARQPAVDRRLQRGLKTREE